MTLELPNAFPRPPQVGRVSGPAPRRNSRSPRGPRIQLFAAVALLLLAAVPTRALAQSLDVSFPLDGRYRVGRYMPVRLAGAPGGPVTLAADGAVPTELPQVAGRVDVVVPWLSVRELARPQWSSGTGAVTPITATLQPLADDERLVALAGDEAGRTRAAAMLFPGNRVVTVRLDLSRPGPLLSPAAAYEALDGVILDAAAAARVDASQLGTLLAAGTTVAVRSEVTPGGPWPWRQEGPYWVVRHNVLGPRGVVDEGAYKPTYPWPRGWPADVRRLVVLLGAVFVVIAVGVTLWRSPRAAYALAGASLAAAVAIVAWGAARSPVLPAAGAVVVWDGTLAQRDVWTYRTTLRPSAVEVPFRDLTRPALATFRQLEQARLRLACTPDGTPERFHADLPADNALAVLSRSASPVRPDATPGQPDASPLYPVAKDLYPDRIIGTGPPVEGFAPAGTTWWGTLVIDAAPAGR